MTRRHDEIDGGMAEKNELQEASQVMMDFFRGLVHEWTNHALRPEFIEKLETNSVLRHAISDFEPAPHMHSLIQAKSMARIFIARAAAQDALDQIQ